MGIILTCYFRHRQIKEVFEKAGVEIVTTEYVEQSETDLTVALTKVNAKNPDMIVTQLANTAQLALAYKQMKELGLANKQKTVIYGTVSKDFVDLAGRAAEGLVSNDIWLPEIPNPENKAFVEAFQREYGEIPRKYACLGYDAAYCLLMGMNAAGTDTDAAKIGAAIRTLKWRGPRGDMSINLKTGRPATPLFNCIVKGGEIRITEVK